MYAMGRSRQPVCLVSTERQHLQVSSSERTVIMIVRLCCTAPGAVGIMSYTISNRLFADDLPMKTPTKCQCHHRSDDRLLSFHGKVEF